MRSSKISGLSLLGAISVMACDAIEPEDVTQELTQAALSYRISSMLVASEEFAMGFIGIPYRISE